MGRLLRTRAAADPPAQARAGGRLETLSTPLLECVVNVSEGRDRTLLSGLSAACGGTLLDVHADPDHHRSVFSLAGRPEAVAESAQALARAAVGALDLSSHAGCHPRIGVVDVVPFVPLRWAGAKAVAQGAAGTDTPTMHLAVTARDRFARWAGSALGLPCFYYGPLPGGGERSLPEIRRHAFRTLRPDTGPAAPHPTAGASAVGARRVLVAYNLWLAGADVSLARRIATAVRGPAVRALAFQVSGGVQVSCNLVDPLVTGPAQVYDEVAKLLGGRTAVDAEGSDSGGKGDLAIERCELVGLVPRAVLERIPAARWPELDLCDEATIDARLEERGIS